MKAFPHSFERVPDHPEFAESEGMDLRDYFAAKAMQVCCIEGNSVSELAKEAYRVADAMMKARSNERT